MRKSLSYQILTAVFTACTLGLYASNPASAEVVTIDNNVVTSHGNKIIASNADFNDPDYNIHYNYNNNKITVSDTTLNNFNGINHRVDYDFIKLSNNNISFKNSTINGKLTGVILGCGRPEVQTVNIKLIDTIVANGITAADINSYGGAPNPVGLITVKDIKLSLEGNSKIDGDVVLFYRREHTHYDATISDSKITVKDNVDLENANLYAHTSESPSYYPTVPINYQNITLLLDGWSGSVKSVQLFNDINFNNVKWKKDGTVLNITDSPKGALTNTNINLNNLNLAGGAELNKGESMTFVKGTDLGIDPGKVTGDNFTAGVAVIGTGEVVADENSVKYVLKEVKQNRQVDLVTKNRAASAAFVNQGTDLISDSLDTLSRDGNYGVKTFAAVHGNRSKYDVNSDLKINGWSTIVGVGNAAEFADGDEFSWGVFYENGSGNYRTFNEFNNEFFRGDGSLVYNGGGIATRYENASGVYTEGSLRAGMLKSEMDNALRDGSGNYYGYDSESAYYGAHIGVGKIIGLSDSSDLDVYGKFFHTYTEGDSFTVDKDKFEFDSITSDRLRIGARVTTNKANAFSTYYGLAYEYEFNGDADMRVQNLKAPTQSLQGSSYMAEVGFNYQPTPDSPWSFDLNMRGYAGEREGASFNVQATYTF